MGTLIPLLSSLSGVPFELPHAVNLGDDLLDPVIADRVGHVDREMLSDVVQSPDHRDTLLDVVVVLEAEGGPDLVHRQAEQARSGVDPVPTDELVLEHGN